MDTSASLLECLHRDADGDAWQMLVELYSPLIRNWLERNGAPQADIEDIAQDVLVVVVRRIPEFRREPRTGAFRSWLRTITVNCLREHWRRKAKQPQAPGGTDFGVVIQQLSDPHSGVSKLWDRAHDEHVVQFLLEQVRAQFSDKTWLAFRRFALDGLTADQVAVELDMSPNAVFIAKSRVLTSLRVLGQGLVD